MTVTITGDGFTVTRRTDAEGSAGDVTLTTPDCALSLDENNTTTRPYAVCDLTAFARRAGRTAPHRRACRSSPGRSHWPSPR